MPQLSLYVDEATMDTLRASAQSAGVSMSKYAAQLIQDRAQFGGWPQGFWESVYGSLQEDLIVDDASVDPALDDVCDWFE